jgi:uncharacterized protein YjiS (DUF1127 family)
MTSTSECLSAPAPEVGSSLFRFLALPRLWLMARRQRRELIELPDYLLADIGLRPVDARTEADKPFWQIPQAWREMNGRD